LPDKLLYGNDRLRLELSDCLEQDGLLYVKSRIYVPNDEALRTEVIRQSHDTVTAGHSGKHNTHSRLGRWYYWPKMTTMVARYVRNCQTCLRTKPYRQGKQGLLHPLPIPDRYWQSISVDFITHLPPSHNNGRTYKDAMVNVDRLSKKKRFIPMTSITAEATALAFVEYVWREEGYPEEIISDRGSQFVSHFWRRLCESLGTKPRLSTSFHPETDGQTENANAFLKAYLRAYVNYEQDDWALFLPMAEFVANSTVSDSTGVAPFMATKGYIPRDGIGPALPLDKHELTTPARLDRQRADQFADHIKRLSEFLRENLQWAQAKQAEYANDKRVPAQVLRVGDRVMLDARNFKTRRPNASLDYKNRGPFTIIRSINNIAFELFAQ
jgi:hypothetical protein